MALGNDWEWAAAATGTYTPLVMHRTAEAAMLAVPINRGPSYATLAVPGSISTYRFLCAAPSGRAARNRHSAMLKEGHCQEYHLETDTDACACITIFELLPTVRGECGVCGRRYMLKEGYCQEYHFETDTDACACATIFELLPSVRGECGVCGRWYTGKHESDEEEEQAATPAGVRSEECLCMGVHENYSTPGECMTCGVVHV